MASRDEDECNSCGVFGNSEELDDPEFHESDCPHAIPEFEVRKVPLPPGQHTISFIRDLKGAGVVDAPPVEVEIPVKTFKVFFNDVQNEISIESTIQRMARFQKARDGMRIRAAILAIYGAELDRLDGLRTRLLYARIEPWGA